MIRKYDTICNTQYDMKWHLVRYADERCVEHNAVYAQSAALIRTFSSLANLYRDSSEVYRQPMKSERERGEAARLDRRKAAEPVCPWYFLSPEEKSALRADMLDAARKMDDAFRQRN